MNIKFLIFLFCIVTIAASLGCIESQKLPAPNETKIITSAPTLSSIEQKSPNETKPLKINDTFETWSRGYYANYYNDTPYLKVITNYSKWIEFLDEQGYFDGRYIDGSLFPGMGVKPRTIEPADFNEHFIIAAMMGLKGFTEEPEIEIKNISRLNNTVNVTVRMYNPSFGETAMSSPYHIVIVKRELLPVGIAIFIFTDTEGKRLGDVEIKPSINLTYVPTSVKLIMNLLVHR